MAERMAPRLLLWSRTAVTAVLCALLWLGADQGVFTVEAPSFVNIPASIDHSGSGLWRPSSSTPGFVKVVPLAKATSARPLGLLLSAACVSALLLRRARVARLGKGKPQTTTGVRVRKPKNNALRNSSIATFEELTTRKRYDPLCFMHRRRFARPRHSPISLASGTGRESGHTHKMEDKHARVYRIIDFGRTKRGMYGTIETIEYDPYRNARICLVSYEDGERRYILHAVGYFVGQQIISGTDAPIFVGNALPLDKVPIGTMVHNVEMNPGDGGAVARAAGQSAIVLSRDDRYVTVKMPSSEVRLLDKRNWCTIGKVGRTEHQLIKLGKAGKSRQLGWRPHVRGSAKNACDHPHGGGEARSPIGHKHQMTPFGKCAKGLHTRKPGMASDKFILIRRKKKSGKN
mmetsp:Transcript_17885/g.39249  ORF Transcript_17885/g.39249 Transcript_17885/m.39249 type:complete len:403 (-) Transcript_17885:70-1278(-)